MQIFTESNADGTATWLHFANGGMPIDQVVHVALSTKEGETPAAFRARCKAINGFPPDLFDVMEPSSTSYFDPLLERAEHRAQRHRPGRRSVRAARRADAQPIRRSERR